MNEEALNMAHEYLAAHETLRKLGFPSEDIFAVITASKTFGLVLKTQDKEFRVLLFENYKCNLQELQQTLLSEINRWNTAMTNEERNQVYEKSNFRKNVVQFSTSLVMSGIKIPKSSERKQDAN